MHGQAKTMIQPIGRPVEAGEGDAFPASPEPVRMPDIVVHRAGGAAVVVQAGDAMMHA